MDGATANGFGDMLQRLQVVEKRLDRIESGDVLQSSSSGCGSGNWVEAEG